MIDCVVFAFSGQSIVDQARIAVELHERAINDFFARCVSAVEIHLERIVWPPFEDAIESPTLGFAAIDDESRDLRDPFINSIASGETQVRINARRAVSPDPAGGPRVVAEQMT